MAAKPKFPGRRVTRSERKGVWYTTNDTINASKPSDTFKTYERSEDLVGRLDEFRSMICGSDEDEQMEFNGFSGLDIARNVSRLQELNKSSLGRALKRLNHKSPNNQTVKDRLVENSVQARENSLNKQTVVAVTRLGYNLFEKHCFKMFPLSSTSTPSNVELACNSCAVSINQALLKNMEGACKEDDGPTESLLSNLSSSCAATPNEKQLVFKKVPGSSTVSKKNSMYLSKFCLPERSAHSSRVITPNKRFLDADDYIVERKKVKVQQKAVLAAASVAVEHDCSPVSELLNIVKDTIEGKHRRDSSTTDKNVSSVPHEPLRGKEQALGNNVAACSIEKTPSEISLSLDNKILHTDETNLPTANNSLSCILQKPKLQLDQAAIDRSKAALALSLRQQMDEESRGMRELSTVDGYMANPISTDYQNTIRFSATKALPQPLGAATVVSSSCPSDYQDGRVSTRDKLVKGGDSLNCRANEPVQSQASSEVEAGPRIKNVCRRAAIVLKQPATFPPAFPNLNPDPEINLSALPQREKLNLFCKRIEEFNHWAANKASSVRTSSKDCELSESMVSSNGNSNRAPSVSGQPRDILESTESTAVVMSCPVGEMTTTGVTPIQVLVASVDAPPETSGSTRVHPSNGKHASKRRTKRCGECSECLAVDCRVCYACRDMIKYGGPGAVKKACIKRRCLNTRCSSMGDCTPLLCTSADLAQPIYSASKSHDTCSNSSEKSFSNAVESQTVLAGIKPSLSPPGTRNALESFPEASGKLNVDGGAEDMQVAFTTTKSEDILKWTKKGGRRNISRCSRPKMSIIESQCLIDSMKQSENLEPEATTSLSTLNPNSVLILTQPVRVPAVCLVCGSNGCDLEDSLVYCAVCCEPYHSYCLPRGARPLVGMESWCCVCCRHCRVCGTKNSSILLQCSRCQECYHEECLGPTYPTLPAARFWKCSPCSQRSLRRAWRQKVAIKKAREKESSSVPYNLDTGQKVSIMNHVEQSNTCGSSNLDSTPLACNSDHSYCVENVREVASLPNSIQLSEFRLESNCKTTSGLTITAEAAAFWDTTKESTGVVPSGSVNSAPLVPQPGPNQLAINRLSVYVGENASEKSYPGNSDSQPQSSNSAAAAAGGGGGDDVVGDGRPGGINAGVLGSSVFTRHRSIDGRCCNLCLHCGDQSGKDNTGRLLFAGGERWVHAACALWSAGVSEHPSGVLHRVFSAISQAKKLHCKVCCRRGASVRCCYPDCMFVSHFPCARRVGCGFHLDKTVLCPSHCHTSNSHKPVTNDELDFNRYFVIRPRLSNRVLRHHHGPTGFINLASIGILTGSLTVESLGELKAVSDAESFLLPVGYCSSRLYWSTSDARKRCIYTCRIVEAIADNECCAAFNGEGQVLVPASASCNSLPHANYNNNVVIHETCAANVSDVNLNCASHVDRSADGYAVDVGVKMRKCCGNVFENSGLPPVKQSKYSPNDFDHNSTFVAGEERSETEGGANSSLYCKSAPINGICCNGAKDVTCQQSNTYGLHCRSCRSELSVSTCNGSGSSVLRERTLSQYNQSLDVEASRTDSRATGSAQDVLIQLDGVSALDESSDSCTESEENDGESLITSDEEPSPPASDYFVVSSVCNDLETTGISTTTSSSKGSIAEKVFKCTKCRQIYRTAQSCAIHMEECDYEVSSSSQSTDDSQSEETSDSENDEDDISHYLIGVNCNETSKTAKLFNTTESFVPSVVVDSQVSDRSLLHGYLHVSAPMVDDVTVQQSDQNRTMLSSGSLYNSLDDIQLQVLANQTLQFTSEKATSLHQMNGDAVNFSLPVHGNFNSVTDASGAAGNLEATTPLSNSSLKCVGPVTDGLKHRLQSHIHEKAALNLLDSIRDVDKQRVHKAPDQLKSHDSACGLQSSLPVAIAHNTTAPSIVAPNISSGLSPSANETRLQNVKLAVNSSHLGNNREWQLNLHLIDPQCLSTVEKELTRPVLNYPQQTLTDKIRPVINVLHSSTLQPRVSVPGLLLQTSPSVSVPQVLNYLEVSSCLPQASCLKPLFSTPRMLPVTKLLDNSPVTPVHRPALNWVLVQPEAQVNFTHKVERFEPLLSAASGLQFHSPQALMSFPRRMHQTEQLYSMSGLEMLRPRIVSPQDAPMSSGPTNHPSKHVLGLPKMSVHSESVIGLPVAVNQAQKTASEIPHSSSRLETTITNHTKQPFTMPQQFIGLQQVVSMPPMPQQQKFSSPMAVVFSPPVAISIPQVSVSTRPICSSSQAQILRNSFSGIRQTWPFLAISQQSSQLSSVSQISQAGFRQLQPCFRMEGITQPGQPAVYSPIYGWIPLSSIRSPHISNLTNVRYPSPQLIPPVTQSFSSSHMLSSSPSIASAAVSGAANLFWTLAAPKTLTVPVETSMQLPKTILHTGSLAAASVLSGTPPALSTCVSGSSLSCENLLQKCVPHSLNCVDAARSLLPGTALTHSAIQSTASRSGSFSQAYLRYLLENIDKTNLPVGSIFRPAVTVSTSVVSAAGNVIVSDMSLPMSTKPHSTMLITSTTAQTRVQVTEPLQKPTITTSSFWESLRRASFEKTSSSNSGETSSQVTLSTTNCAERVSVRNLSDAQHSLITVLTSSTLCNRVVLGLPSSPGKTTEQTTKRHRVPMMQPMDYKSRPVPALCPPVSTSTAVRVPLPPQVSSADPSSSGLQSQFNLPLTNSSLAMFQRLLAASLLQSQQQLAVQGGSPVPSMRALLNCQNVNNDRFVLPAVSHHCNLLKADNPSAVPLQWQACQPSSVSHLSNGFCDAKTFALSELSILSCDYEHVDSALLDDADDHDVCDSLLLSQYLKYAESQAPSVVKPSSSRLKFEITSDDGFFVRADTCDEAWKAVIEAVQDARSRARMKQLSFAGLTGLYMFGLACEVVQYLLELLPDIETCQHYKRKYEEEDSKWLSKATATKKIQKLESGCARTEKYPGRKPTDMFSFLLSQHRSLPPDFRPSSQRREVDNMAASKAQRRHSAAISASVDMPMTMRFRQLRSSYKETVAVYQSGIHRRGLFARRDIDNGEMVIEYAGEVIRSVLTDRREQLYERRRTTGGDVGCYMFRLTDSEVVDATLTGNAARFINHSCEPNCYSKVVDDGTGRKHIVIFAQRSISRGEELTYDYKFPIEDVKILCSCSSRRCKKYLN